MSGYSNDFSMSNNAVSAYNDGLLPASKLAKKLGVSTAAVREVLQAAEAHHTSSRYNLTEFFSDDVTAEDWAAMKKFDGENHIPEKIVEGDFFIEEWSGTRRYPHRDIQPVSGKIIHRGHFWLLPNGTRKKRLYRDAEGISEIV